MAKWVEDGVVKLPAVEREPTKKEMQSLKYCIYHRIGRHVTKDCWAFRALIVEKIASRELELNKTDQNIANNPLLRHNNQTHMISCYGEQDIVQTQVEEEMEVPQPAEDFTASKLQNAVKFK